MQRYESLKINIPFMLHHIYFSVSNSILCLKCDGLLQNLQRCKAHYSTHEPYYMKK